MNKVLVTTDLDDMMNTDVRHIIKAGRYRKNGVWLTQMLFADVLKREGKDDCPFWLETNQLNDKRPVFRDEFLRLNDPTGYELAMLHLGNVEHLEHLLNKVGWFRSRFEEWRKELILKQQSLAKQVLLDLTSSEKESIALSAAKAILDQGKTTKKEEVHKKRGRPSKDEVKGKLKEEARTEEETEADYQRILN